MRLRNNWPRRRGIFLLFCAAIFNAAAEPGHFSERWEILKDCQLVDSEWNDGDSFHIVSGGKEYIFRLYFVDTAETHDVSEGKARTTEQARYWKISKPALSIMAGIATEFSKARLKGAPFTVITRWEDAKGQSKLPRNFAIIKTSTGDLGELLVANGLARIHGHYLAHPDGISAAKYREKLVQLEARAKKAGLGAWGVTSAKTGVKFSSGELPAESEPSPAGPGADIPAF